MEDIHSKLAQILRCQLCGFILTLGETSFVCANCGSIVRIRNRAVDFVDVNEVKRRMNPGKAEEAVFYSPHTLKARLYQIGTKIISCDYVVKEYLKEFLARVKKDNILVELGSGNRRCREDVVNVDIFPFPNVDVLSDIKKVPFGDNTVDYIIIDAVLEHVAEPQEICREVFRILKAGGMAFCVVPFIHQYHAHPKHYFNITEDGLQYLFRGFSKCEVKLYRGPTSAIVSLIAEYFALALSGNRSNVYMGIRAFVLFFISWLKYLDKLWFRSKKSMRICNALCAVITK